MKNSVFHFTLDLHKQDSQVFVPVRKGDTAFKLSARLTESGTPYELEDGVTVVLAATTSAGSNKYGNATVTENRIEITLPASFVAQAETLRCCFQIEGSSAALTSPPFTILVDNPAAPKQS